MFDENPDGFDIRFARVVDEPANASICSCVDTKKFVFVLLHDKEMIDNHAPLCCVSGFHMNSKKRQIKTNKTTTTTTNIFNSAWAQEHFVHCFALVYIILFGVRAILS